MVARIDTLNILREMDELEEKECREQRSGNLYVFILRQMHRQQPGNFSHGIGEV